MKHKRFNISNYNTVIANRLIHRRLNAMTNQNGFENGFNNKINIELNEKRFCCEFCNETFTNGQGLGGHMSRKHKDKSLKALSAGRLQPCLNSGLYRRRDNLFPHFRSLFCQGNFLYNSKEYSYPFQIRGMHQSHYILHI